MNTSSAVLPLKGWRLNVFPFTLVWRERITPPPDFKVNARRYLYGIGLFGGSTIIGIIRTVQIPRAQK